MVSSILILVSAARGDDGFGRKGKESDIGVLVRRQQWRKHIVVRGNCFYGTFVALGWKAKL